MAKRHQPNNNKKGQRSHNQELQYRYTILTLVAMYVKLQLYFVTGELQTPMKVEQQPRLPARQSSRVRTNELVTVLRANKHNKFECTQQT